MDGGPATSVAGSMVRAAGTCFIQEVYRIIEHA